MDKEKGKYKKPDKRPKREAKTNSKTTGTTPRNPHTQLPKKTSGKTMETQPEPQTKDIKTPRSRSHRPQKSRTKPTRRLKTRRRSQKSTAETPKIVTINRKNYSNRTIKLTETAENRADQTFGTIILYLNIWETNAPGLRAGVG